MDSMSFPSQVDVAIVGGGVSGIYTGWRLLTAAADNSGRVRSWASKSGPGGKLKVALFEGSQRIGGRLLSARPPGMAHVTCEIGGMRYVSSQTLIRSLIENELRLPRHEQVVDDPRNIAFLRGKHLRVGQLPQPSALPYGLDVAEAHWLEANNATPAGLIGWALAQVLPEVTKLNGAALDTYLQNAQVDGTPLYQHGFWNLLARAMSSEAYALARATVGYDSLGANANAVDLASEYFNFTPGVKYYLLNDGYDAVPWTLQQRFTDAGGAVFQDSWLEGFDSTTLDDGTTGVLLRFGGERPEVKARAIVLALPQRALQALRQQGPVFDPARAPHVQFMLKAVEPVALYKLFIAYGWPWWEAMGVTQGRSLTDIPLRQCYYWAVEGRAPGGEANNSNATIMVYNDVSSAEFWGGLRRLPLGPGDTTAKAAEGWRRAQGGRVPAARVFARKPMPGAHRGAAAEPFARRLRQNWDDHQAPHEMVAEVHRQLMSLHNVRYAPEPLEAAYMDWSDAPFGAGVHFWNPGYKSWEVLEAMIQPVADVPCFVCGEAYSTNQTWVEGALQTAELVLQKRLGLPPPVWVTP
jgi:monoamine oxidase